MNRSEENKKRNPNKPLLDKPGALSAFLFITKEHLMFYVLFNFFNREFNESFIAIIGFFGITASIFLPTIITGQYL